MVDPPSFLWERSDDWMGGPFSFGGYCAGCSTHCNTIILNMSALRFCGILKELRQHSGALPAKSDESDPILALAMSVIEGIARDTLELVRWEVPEHVESKGKYLTETMPAFLAVAVAEFRHSEHWRDALAYIAHMKDAREGTAT